MKGDVTGTWGKHYLGGCGKEFKVNLLETFPLGKMGREGIVVRLFDTVKNGLNKQKGNTLF